MSDSLIPGYSAYLGVLPGYAAVVDIVSLPLIITGMADVRLWLLCCCRFTSWLIFDFCLESSTMLLLDMSNSFLTKGSGKK